MRSIEIGYGVKEIFEDEFQINKSTLRTIGVLLDYIGQQIQDNGDCLMDLRFMTEFLLIDEMEFIQTMKLLEAMGIVSKEKAPQGVVHLYADPEEIDSFASQGYLNRGVEYYS